MTYPSAKMELEYLRQGFAVIAGLDEAGKGAWAGPVVAGAVILPEKVDLPGLNDSKLVTARGRERLYTAILAQAIAWGVGIQEAHVVDEIGLSAAHHLAMQQAVESLAKRPELVLVDGLSIKQLGVKAVCIVKGDRKVRCIAAASIIAKVTRDRLMRSLHEQFPEYGFADHKGYGTAQHQEAIIRNGVCDLHRLSYRPVYQGWQRSLFAV
ncbi:MAG: ribonuclease HII [Parcubacteria group bacterium]|nr:ribonuclease HII [Parcubacteria group bacterium]